MRLVMHKRGNSIKILATPERVIVGDREIDITGLRPIDLMLAALAYGIGIRYIDMEGRPFEMECEIEGYEIKCKAKCTGQEEKCVVYRALTKGTLKFECKEDAHAQGTPKH